MTGSKVKITDPTRILTLANLISLLRAVLSIPIIYTLYYRYDFYTFVLILIAVASDALDGFFARRAHEVTHIGKWLDPIADFIVILSVAFFLVLFDQFPAWFFWIYLIRYVLIALPAIYLINHTHFVLAANWTGKWSCGISVLAITLHIFPIQALEWLKNLSLAAALVLLLISYIQYMVTFLKEFRKI